MSRRTSDYSSGRYAGIPASYTSSRRDSRTRYVTPTDTRDASTSNRRTRRGSTIDRDMAGLTDSLSYLNTRSRMSRLPERDVSELADSFGNLWDDSYSRYTPSTRIVNNVSANPFATRDRPSSGTSRASRHTESTPARNGRNVTLSSRATSYTDLPGIGVSGYASPSWYTPASVLMRRRDRTASPSRTRTSNYRNRSRTPPRYESSRRSGRRESRAERRDSRERYRYSWER